MDFIDRTEERARLMRFFASPEGGLACVYGRRRCGKTRLLQECAKVYPNTFYYLADRSERPAQIGRFVREISSQLSAFRAASGEWGAVLDLWLALAPRNSVLIFDEFPYLAERDASLPSVLQRITDQLPSTGCKVVICGSSQRMMQGFVLKQSEPLYGRAREILPIEPIPFMYMREAFPSWSAMERLNAWSVWGGVPRYWELQAEERDWLTAVRRHVFSPLGVLRNEPQFLLLDDFGDVAQATTVLSFIGGGAHRISEIASRMGRPASDMTRPIRRLCDLGLVAKETPFGAEDGGKRSIYRIADPFLDFWHTFVHPNWSQGDFLAEESGLRRFEGQFRQHLGGVWERLARETLAHKGLAELGGRPRRIGRWWGNGIDRKPMEIDILAESQDGETLLAGEAKLSLAPDEFECELRTLENKARKLPFAEKYRAIVLRLFITEASPHANVLSLDWTELT